MPFEGTNAINKGKEKRASFLSSIEDACDPNCKCPSGIPFPSEGKVYCGWCGAVEPINGATMMAQDVIECKPNGCCDYGDIDDRCHGKVGEWPDYNKFCPHQPGRA